MKDYPKYPYYSKQTKYEEKPVAFPPQHQDQQPGLEYVMHPKPIYENPNYMGSQKLKDQVAIITLAKRHSLIIHQQKERSFPLHDPSQNPSMIREFV